MNPITGHSEIRLDESYYACGHRANESHNLLSSHQKGRKGVQIPVGESCRWKREKTGHTNPSDKKKQNSTDRVTGD